jgi:CheY-like chemotaxis protein
VLVADPDPEQTALCTRALAPGGYVIEHADTGPEALALALREPPQVIVVDAALPQIDGFSLCQILRQDANTRHAAIVMMSDDLQPDDLERARRSGADAVLHKQMLQDSLADAIAGIARREDAPAPQPRGRTRAPRATLGLAAPPLRCPVCDAPLSLEQTYSGGVRTVAEQWDIFRCPRQCGTFEYRHRTRRLRRIPER